MNTNGIEIVMPQGRSLMPTRLFSRQIAQDLRRIVQNLSDYCVRRSRSLEFIKTLTAGLSR